MRFFDELRKGVKNIIISFKKDMVARAVENKEIKEIEHEAAFQERKKQAGKTAKYRVELKGKNDREHIKHPIVYNAPQSFGMTGSQLQPQTKQTKTKKQKQVQQELFDPNTAMDMVNFNPFKTK